MNITYLPALIILIPMLIASAISLSNNIKFAKFIAITCLIIVNLIAFKLMYLAYTSGPIHYVFGGFEKFIAIEYKVTLFNAYFLSLISILSLFIMLNIKEQISICLFTITGVLGIIITNDIFNFYVFLEICSLSSYGLIAINQNKKSLVSALQYLIYGTIGACFILIGIGLILMITGSLNMDIAAFELGKTQHLMLKNLSLIFITIGILFKLAVFPMYGWLPKLYNNSNTVIAGFLASIMPCLYFYLLAKFYFSIYEFNKLPSHFIQILSYVALVTILIGSIFSLFTKNLKEIWGYSSITNIGYGLLIITLGSKENALSSLVILITIHGFLKLVLFLITNKLDEKNKLANILLLINCASLIGLPLTAGFINKWNLITLNNSNYLNLAIIAISSVFSLLYFIKLVEKYWPQKSRHDDLKSESLVNSTYKLGDLCNKSMKYFEYSLIIIITFINLFLAFPGKNFTLFIQKVASSI